MATFVIRKDVPMVAASRGRKPTEFPLADMEPGDCFDIDIEAGEDGTIPVKAVESWRRKVRVSAKAFVAQYGEGYKFTTTAVPEGLRVYRTA